MILARVLISMMLLVSTAAAAKPVITLEEMYTIFHTNWQVRDRGASLFTRCHDQQFLSMGDQKDGFYSAAFTVATNYEPEYGQWGITPFLGLKGRWMSPSSFEVNLIGLKEHST